MKAGIFGFILLAVFGDTLAFAKSEIRFPVTYEATLKGGRTERLTMNTTATQAGDLLDSALFGTNSFSQGQSFSPVQVKAVVDTIFSRIFLIDYPHNRFSQMPDSIRNAVMKNVRIQLGWKGTTKYLQLMLAHQGFSLSSEEKSIVDKYLDMLLIQDYLLEQQKTGQQRDLMWSVNDGWNKLSELSINLSFHFRHDLQKGETVALTLLAIFGKFMPSARQTMIRSVELTAGLNSNNTAQSARSLDVMVRELQNDTDQKFKEHMNFSTLHGAAVGAFAAAAGWIFLNYLNPDFGNFTPAILHPLTQALIGTMSVYLTSYLFRILGRARAIEMGLRDQLAKTFNFDMEHNFGYRGMKREWEIRRQPKDCRQLLVRSL